MSRLHKEAKELVKFIADGKWCEFTPAELELLSRWALMVSINLECHAHMMVTIKPHLEDLMNGKMPKGWRVYIGQLPSNKHANYNHTRIFETSMKIERDFYHKVKNTAFCIEHVLFNTVSITGGDSMLEIAKYSVVSLQLSNPLTCIWSIEVQKPHEGTVKVDDSIFDFIDSF